MGAYLQKADEAAREKAPVRPEIVAHNGPLVSRVFESFDDIPDAWRQVCRSGDLGMDLNVLRIFQKTLARQCRCWGVIVYDASGETIGCAALCMFRAEIIESANAAWVGFRNRLRRYWPDFGFIKVLFCGLPVPSGTSHLRIREGAPAERVIQEINRVMHRLAHATSSSLMVFKEMDDAFEHYASFLALKGYVRGEIPPMHLLDAHFASFADYRDSLKSRYRAQVLRSQKKLAAAGFTVLQGRGAEFFAAHFNEQSYALYVAMRNKAEMKLELLPMAFFVELAAALGDEVCLTLITRADRIYAFTFAITRDGVHYNLYSGLDYALNREGDLYFNLFYSDLDIALSSEIKSLHLGQTSDSFKSRLGSKTRPLWFFVRARSAFFNRILKPLAPLAFPKIKAVETNNVFAATNKN